MCVFQLLRLVSKTTLSNSLNARLLFRCSLTGNEEQTPKQTNGWRQTVQTKRKRHKEIMAVGLLGNIICLYIFLFCLSAYARLDILPKESYRQQEGMREVRRVMTMRRKKMSSEAKQGVRIEFFDLDRVGNV